MFRVLQNKEKKTIRSKTIITVAIILSLEEKFMEYCVSLGQNPRVSIVSKYLNTCKIHIIGSGWLGYLGLCTLLSLVL